MLDEKRKEIRKAALMFGTLAEKRKRNAPFIPGETPIPASGKVVGGPEVLNATMAALDMHFTEGRFVKMFEEAIAEYLGIRCASMCNSGSSANLLAMAVLKDILLDKRKGLPPMSNIITAAAGFPTTVNPIIQYGMHPNFVDVEIGTYVPTIDMIADAVDENTVAIFMGHTLGNPIPLDAVLELCALKGLLLIEDNCDALGSLYGDKMTGTFGLMSTLSLYPAHHMTAGEGGVVFTTSPRIQKAINSYRDWGRDCWCKTGEENTCGKRFDWDFPGLPDDYDHKYIYNRIGYNLKSTDFQGAIALAQTLRLEEFAKRRRENFKYLYNLLYELEDYIHLPRATINSTPNWFGFPITIRKSGICGELTQYLDKHNIGTRRLFGGNMLRQPAYSALPATALVPNSEFITANTFWVGVWPGLGHEMIEYTAEKITAFFKKEI